MSPARLAWINLASRPMRAAMLAVIVGLSLATALTLLVLSESIARGLGESADERGADLTVAQRDAPDIFSGYLPEALEQKIRATPGVAGVAGELAMFAPIDDARQAIVLGWSRDAYFWTGAPMRDGRVPAPGESRAAMIGEGVATAFGKSVGDQISIYGEPFRIVGVSAFKSAVNRGVIVVGLSDLQELSFRAGQVTAFQISLDRGVSGAGLDDAKRRIESLGRVVVTPTDQLLASDRNYAFLQAVSRATSTIALAMGGLSLFGSLMMAVHERRRELGVLSAIGWSAARIRLAVLAEGLLIGSLGALVAIPMVLLASTLFRHLPGIGEYLAFEPSAALFGWGAVAAILLSAAGSVYPAMKATRGRPAEALRSI